MKIFIASLITETNSFSPIPTGAQAFAHCMVAHGNGSHLPETLANISMHVWRHAAEEDGHSIIESLTARAEPGGPTIEKVYREFRDEILADVVRAGLVDLVLLSLHGAMMSSYCDDCEGDILTHIRKQLGPNVVICGLLDPHAHLTTAMLENATILLTYKEYPHIDIPERAKQIYALAIDAALGKTHPLMCSYDCRMVHSYPTQREPIHSFIESLSALERSGDILSASLVHGFPWGDCKDSGTKILVVSNDDAVKAKLLAEKIGKELFDLRGEIFQTHPTIERAIQIIEREIDPFDQRPMVLADMADNPGGGAPGDSTFFLEALLNHGFTSIAAGIFWDPMTVDFCYEAGEGAQFTIRFGGKCGPASGRPIDAIAIVRALREDVTQIFGQITIPLGRGVWISIGGLNQDIDVILTDTRIQTYHPDAFTGFGMKLEGKRIVIVKSSQHFQQGFTPMAQKIVQVATPGTITPNFSAIPYEKRSLDYWPRVSDPFSII